MIAAGKSPADTVPATTRELVLLRASHINGRGVCVDMHKGRHTRRGDLHPTQHGRGLA
jgi:AhpD family alkylhydroperoxidase